ncbi:MAG: SIMPL domain-containing protein [Bacteroidaceae bacterium]|nr:SIMPL domain-containing protein [Bacteroidaceae bacterium]
MKQILKFAAVAIIAIAPATIWAQTESQPYIMQNITCEQEVTPDELYISITINEKENKGKQSVEELQTKMIKELQSLHIDVEKALTLNFMGSEVSYTTFRRSAVPRTTATYILKLSDADTMQKVVAKLEALGITNISLARTNYSKENEIYNELGAKAMKQAKEAAASLAGAIGQSIGAAISVNSNRYSSGNAQPRLYKARNTMLSEVNIDDIADDGPRIEVGKITYNVNVNVKFLLSE